MNKILEVQTEHTNSFKTLVEVLKDMLPEANIEFFIKKPHIKNERDKPNKNNSDSDSTTSDNDIGGMKITSVDTTQTVLIHVKLDIKNFSTFKMTKKNFIIGLNLIQFHKLIKSAEKDDIITLSVDEFDQNILKINILGPKKSKKVDDKLKLLDLGDEKIELPVTHFDAVIQMNAAEFHKVCRELKQLADCVHIICTSNSIKFKCIGEYVERDLEYGTDEDKQDSVNIQFTGNTKMVYGTYELNNLVLFGKCSTLCSDIQIYMKKNYPMIIRYILPNLGKVLLCLTPKNEDAEVENNNNSEEYYSDDE